MKTKRKTLVTICLTLVLCLSMAIPAFAIGHAGYRNYYHDGNNWKGSYTISTNSIALPMKQMSVELGNFNSDTSVVIAIFNSKGQRMRDDLWLTGNGKANRENLSLISSLFKNGDTYTIQYNVYHGGTTPLSGDDGWIGIWIY